MTFSYLPAGTPPWPTSVPAKMPYGREQAASATTVSGSQKEKSKRSLRSVLLAVAILVLVPILGSVFTLSNLYFSGDLFATHSKPVKAISGQVQPTPAPQQTPNTTQSNQLPDPASFSNASDKDLNVSLKYPSDWQEETPSKSTNAVSMAIHPTQPIIVFLVARYLGSASSQIAGTTQLNQARINGISNQIGATGVQNVPLPNAKPTIGGATWDESDVVFNDSNGTQNHLATISVLHNKSYYNIIVLMLDNMHTEAMQKYIQPMLDSVQFLS